MKRMLEPLILLEIILLRLRRQIHTVWTSDFWMKCKKKKKKNTEKKQTLPPVQWDCIHSSHCVYIVRVWSLTAARFNISCRIWNLLKKTKKKPQTNSHCRASPRSLPHFPIITSFPTFYFRTLSLCRASLLCNHLLLLLNVPVSHQPAPLQTHTHTVLCLMKSY